MPLSLLLAASCCSSPLFLSWECWVPGSSPHTCHSGPLPRPWRLLPGPSASIVLLHPAAHPQARLESIPTTPLCISVPVPGYPGIGGFGGSIGKLVLAQLCAVLCLLCHEFSAEGLSFEKPSGNGGRMDIREILPLQDYFKTNKQNSFPHQTLL